MREFRKKQKRLKKIMNIMCIITAVYMLIYIGIEPSLANNIGSVPTMIVAYLGDGLIIASLIILFLYFNKYGKSDKFLESVEDEIEDVGYYYTSREEKTIEDYYKVVIDDLRENGYAVDEKVEIDGFEFTARAMKKKQFFYIVCDENIDKNDVIAYQQSAIYDVTAVNVKRKGNGVILYITDKIDETAIELSKMITPLGKKGQIKFANAIVELGTKRCYFLGNRPTMCQNMIANFAMNCQVPIKEQYKGKEKLQFQFDLEEHMKDFNIKDYNNGEFFAH